MPDTTVKLQDITPVKSTFDNDDQLLLINPTGEARISKEDFLDAMPDDAITLIGDITVTGIEGDTVAKQLGALENSKAPAITETTESSAIANFTDGADDMAMHNIVADIDPVQDLTYGDPYPAGGGKNLYSILIGDDVFQKNASATFSNVDGTLKIEMTSATSSGVYATSLSVIKPLIMSLSGEYTLSFDIKASQSGAVICGTESFTSTSITATTSWQRFSFTNTYATPNTTFVCYNRSGNAMTVEIKNLQICLSSATDPTVYAPYSNICPITGWTGVNVTKTGKNLLPPISDDKTLNGVTWHINEDNSISVSGTASENSIVDFGRGHLTLEPGTYTTNRAKDGVLCAIWKNSSPAQLINGGGGTFTLAEKTPVFIRFYVASGSTVNTTIYPQLELGSTATAYEPYQGTTLSVDWSTEAGTVYGGTIDVATGLLTVTNKKVAFNDLTWVKEGTYFFANTGDGYLASSTQEKIKAISSIYRSESQATGGASSSLNVIYPMATIPRRILARPSGYADLDVASWLANVGTETIVYELATPQTYQLTPQEVKTLLGTNNVWADTGNVSVTYPADTKMYIQNLTQPSEDDLVANQAITSGKYFMIGNSLYLALANIASGAQITIGTNAQRVSLADALNTINS